ncbi:MAG: 3-hydroxyacyl-ACP dehydratase FabZ [Xanthomonadales bacterium]|nr:3-hydroxyacyl-ACP dehydratase FabZ [Xanthomonadales bacterium]ODU94840.1 MAG: 3-hydroxyacyl-[acyl-carrier-protein] dehydratase FabZ [Rhodanobacter sp. SCN 66-43]OJY82827.1 MAG: 3-hydroxyacyl-[acyl-carrier-protein] dehydratase FabZ [Xanthomonadales bacterium 66-474]
MNDPATPVNLPVDAERIAAILPHRYPFLLVDRVIDFTPGKNIVAIKNVTLNEPFFQGHFPGHPVMPGVLIVEALAQASGLLIGLSGTHANKDDRIFYLAKVDNARFLKPVVPGDQLRLEVQLKRLLRGMGLFTARAVVDGKDAATCELMCAETTR